MNYRPFVLVSHLRSGTHLLRTSLESHPAIVCQSEVFNSDNRDLPYPLSTPTREILERWVYCDYPPAIRFVGFVLQAYHPRGLSLVPAIRENPNWDDVWTMLAEMPGLRVLHLKRRNLLRRHVSHLVARASGTWHAWDSQAVDRVTHLGSPPPAQVDAGPANRPQVTLDATQLEADFLDVERARRFADQALRDHAVMEIVYEQLCQEYNVVCAQVQRFLGVVPVLALQPAVSKLERRSLAETITNYEALKRHFAGTRWEAFFDE